MNIRAFSPALAAVVGAALLAVPAHAAALEMRVKQVRYADLDLSDAKDRARLDARLARAATTVCGSKEVRDLRLAAEAAACQQAALEQAHNTLERRLAARRGTTRVASVAGE